MATIVIATSYNQSVTSKYFFAVAEEMAQRGHQAILIVDNQKTKIVNRDSNPAIFTWPSKRPVHIKDAFFLDKIIKQYHPDCVIGNFGADNICLIVSALNRIPHRWIWYHTLTTAFLPTLRNKILRVRKRAVLQLATKIIPNSSAGMADIQQAYKINPDRISKPFPFLINTPEITSKINPNLIICTGRLDKNKGQETLLQAIPLICKINNQIQVEFIGDGVDRQYYEDLAKSLNIAAHCHFTGNIPQNEVVKKMAGAMISIVPSHSEALGIVNIESLSVGTPVIASNVGGIRDVIIDGETGFLVPPGDHKILAEKILEILNNSDLRQHMSEEAHQRYLKFFSFNVLSEHVDEIERLISG